MQIVPLQAIPSQVLNISLGGQNCTIAVKQQAYGLFLDLYVNNTLIVGGVICQNANKIVRDLYFGFLGDLAFIDNSGLNSDPYYTGLGTTYSLCYLEVADLPAGQG